MKKAMCIGALALMGMLLVREAPRMIERGHADKFDADEPGALEKAIRYSRQRERLWIISTGFGLCFGIASALSGLPAWLSSRLPRKWATPAFILAWSLFGWVASLPLSFYSGFVVEHRFGLSNQSVWAWLKDELKGLGLGLALNVPLVSGFFWLVRHRPRAWWWITSLLALPLTVAFAGLFPVLIAPLFNKYEPIEDEELERRIRALAEREGVHVSQVLEMDMSRQTSKTNAFFAGLGHTKRIVLADTLLAKLSPDEIESVVAHELGHQVHRDIWRLVGIGTVATFAATLLVDRLFPLAVRLAGKRAPAHEMADVRSLPLLSVLLNVLGLIAFPLVNAYSRSIERAADRYAVRVTDNPAAFIGAMRQLQRTNLADPNPPAWVRVLLHSHPTIGERVAWGEAQVEHRAR